MAMESSAHGNSPISQRVLSEKQEVLFARLRSIDSILVAFSGGADSAYLAWAAHRELGGRAGTGTAPLRQSLAEATLQAGGETAEHGARARITAGQRDTVKVGFGRRSQAPLV